jgi:hypothetical protein
MADLSRLRRTNGLLPAVPKPTDAVHPAAFDLFPGIEWPCRDIYDDGA